MTTTRRIEESKTLEGLTLEVKQATAIFEFLRLEVLSPLQPPRNVRYDLRFTRMQGTASLMELHF